MPRPSSASAGSGTTQSLTWYDSDPLAGPLDLPVHVRRPTTGDRRRRSRPPATPGTARRDRARRASDDTTHRSEQNIGCSASTASCHPTLFGVRRQLGQPVADHRRGRRRYRASPAAARRLTSTSTTVPIVAASSIARRLSSIFAFRSAGSVEVKNPPRHSDETLSPASRDQPRRLVHAVLLDRLAPQADPGQLGLGAGRDDVLAAPVLGRRLVRGCSGSRVDSTRRAAAARIRATASSGSGSTPA